MSVLRVRPWTSHEDIVLQILAAAGKYAAVIAAAMTRSEAAIRTHALVYCADYRCSHSIQMSADRRRAVAAPIRYLGRGDGWFQRGRLSWRPLH
jgi:hypothetical protein